MTIASVDFDRISEKHLQEHVAAAVPEGLLIDFKVSSYGKADVDKREFLRDVSSFANMSGGHLIIGMDEVEGIPTVRSLQTGNPDEELQRLESLTASGLEPRIVGLRMKAVKVAGGLALVIRIPQAGFGSRRLHFLQLLI